MYATGEKPGEGTYICTTCHLEVVVRSNSEELPRCPDCNATIYNEIV